MRLLMLLIIMAGIQATPVPALAETTTPATQTQKIKYLDVTAREDGWGVAVATAVQASRKNKVVIVSYLDPQQTRALYDEALRFSQKSAQPRIAGVIRSPNVPENVTQTVKNPLGFDIFFDGLAVPPVANVDQRFTRAEELETALRVLHKRYFSGQGR